MSEASTLPAAKPKKKRERLMFRVERGRLEPADAYTAARLREKGLKIGDIVAIDITKPRSPGFWRLAHRLGTLCARNIEAFSNLDAHQVLKKVQCDAGIECDESRHEIPGVGVMISRVARSLSFESMDQASFYEVFRAMCRYVAATYWTTMTAEQIEEMAESMLEEA